MSDSENIEEVLLESYEVLRVLVDSLEKDINKSLKGNKSAGVRLRKSLREIVKKTTAMNNRSCGLLLGIYPTPSLAF